MGWANDKPAGKVYKVATATDLARFDEKNHPGPTLQDFILDLDFQHTPNSPWNKAAAEVFADGFLEAQFQSDDRDQIILAFKSYLKTLKRHFLDQRHANDVAYKSKAKATMKKDSAKKRAEQVGTPFIITLMF